MLSAASIFKNSSKLTAGNLLGAVLSFASGLYIARTLGPNQLGAANLVLLWLTYANLARLGILEGGIRELNVRLGRQQHETARHIQNSALTGELLWGVVPVTALLVGTLLAPDPVRRTGLGIVALTYVGMIVTRSLVNFHLARQHFNVCARINLVRAMAQPLMLVTFVTWLGPYGLFVGPLLVEWLVASLYLFRAPKLGLRITIDRPLLRQLLGIGLPLGLGIIVYWAYRLVGTTSVAMWLPTHELGYYAFISSILTLVLQAFGDFAGVLTPSLWAELARVGNAHQISREHSRITLLVTLAACAVTNLGQATFEPFIRLVLPDYLPAVPVFNILAFNIVVLTITFVPSLVLSSAQVNKQWAELGCWVLGLGLNVAANYLVVRQGLRLQAIAWNDIWVQLVVVLLIYTLAQRHLFATPSEAWRLYGRLAAMLGLAALMFVALTVGPLTFATTQGPIGLLGLSTLRLGLTAAVWGGLSVLVYQRLRQPRHGVSLSDPSA